MKRITAAAALTLAFAGVTACASTPGQMAAPPAGFDAAATEFTGWIRVEGEEFRFYQTEVQARNGGVTPCVSGALPRDLQRAAGDLNGQKVRLFGRTRAWSERGDRALLNLQGSQIENLCRRAVVIQADRVEAI